MHILMYPANLVTVCHRPNSSWDDIVALGPLSCMDANMYVQRYDYCEYIDDQEQ